MMFLLAVGGCALLFGGGELLVRGAVAVALRLRISSLLVGMTIVAFCTSAPELLVSLEAALTGLPDIGVGNVVGSNIANVLLILGAAALACPILVDRRELRRDTLVMLVATFLLAGLGLTGQIERWHGVTMVSGLVAYVWYSYWTERHTDAPSAALHASEADEFAAVTRRLRVAFLYLGIGFVALVAGSRMLVTGAAGIAHSLGVSEAVIGLTMVAVGTSLPELATSLVAAARGHADVAVGNVVGSNVFNVLSILGLVALVTPIPFSAEIASFDTWVMVATALVLAALLLWRGRIGRVAGAVLLAAYAAYVIWLY